MLREVFDDHPEDLFGKFLRELTKKEVKRVDHLRIEQRAEYFAKHYKVSFGSKKEIQDLKEIMDRRNRISHEIYYPPPHSNEQLKDPGLVGDETLTRARQLFREVPARCIGAGRKLYRHYFR